MAHRYPLQSRHPLREDDGNKQIIQMLFRKCFLEKKKTIKKILVVCSVALLVSVLNPSLDLRSIDDAIINIDTSGGMSSRSSLSSSDRQLSINYGGGMCEWEPPLYDVPENIDFYKTMVVGFPSGDKRLTFVQMEALTGWPAKDEWDFEYLGQSNHPFIKANYPHHEGIWGWEDNGDQVVMVVRNIRRALTEYHDILWDIGYAKTWEDAFEKIPNLYAERPPLEDFLAWRDLRVIDEICWYGWFIDYWMEGGLLRDIFTHNLTTPLHWDILMQPTVYSRSEQEAAFVPTTEKSYDVHCENNRDVSGGCQPIKILSGELLVEPGTGPAENRKIAEVLMNHPNMSKWVIEEEAWECIWTELIINKKGLKTFIDREGLNETSYNFSEEMLEAMLTELDRLITKYSGPEWYPMEISQDLVSLLNMHRGMIDTELQMVKNNSRLLKDSDFLGPKERRRRKMERIMAASPSVGTFDEERSLNAVVEGDSKDYSEWFDALNRHLLHRREKERKEEVIENERRRRARQLNRVPTINRKLININTGN